MADLLFGDFASMLGPVIKTTNSSYPTKLIFKNIFFFSVEDVPSRDRYHLHKREASKYSKRSRACEVLFVARKRRFWSRENKIGVFPFLLLPQFSRDT